MARSSSQVPFSPGDDLLTNAELLVKEVNDLFSVPLDPGTPEVLPVPAARPALSSSLLGMGTRILSAASAPAPAPSNRLAQSAPAPSATAPAVPVRTAQPQPQPRPQLSHAPPPVRAVGPPALSESVESADLTSLSADTGTSDLSSSAQPSAASLAAAPASAPASATLPARVPTLQLPPPSPRADTDGVATAAAASAMTDRPRRTGSLSSARAIGSVAVPSSPVDSERTRLRYLVRVMLDELEQARANTRAAFDAAHGCKAVAERLRAELTSVRTENILLKEELARLREANVQLQGVVERQRLVKEHCPSAHEYIHKTVPIVQQERQQAELERAQLAALVEQQRAENQRLYTVLHEMNRILSLPPDVYPMSLLLPPSDRPPGHRAGPAPP